MIDILKFLESENIPFKGPNSRGYIVLDTCVFCGKKKKLNILVHDDPLFSEEEKKIKKGFTRCYSCGTTGLDRLYAAIKNIELEEAKRICFGGLAPAKNVFKIDFGRPDLETYKEVPTQEILQRYSPVPMPELSRLICENDIEAIRYLEKRGCPFEMAKKLKIHVLESDDVDRLKEIYFKNRPYNHENFESFKVVCRFRGRVIFPVIMNGINYGFVARDYIGRPAEYKVLNSSGPLSSAFVWNYDQVKQSERLVICEGIFDAINCGSHQSIAILGKNVVETSDKIKLLSRLNPDEIVIYLDNGAYDMAMNLGQIFSKIHPLVKIVVTTPVINKILTPDQSSFLAQLVGEIRLDENSRSILSPNKLMRLKEYRKIILESKDIKDVWENFNKRMRLHKFKGDKKTYSIIKDWIVNFGKEHLSARPQALDDISLMGYLDAGDRGIEENLKLIESAELYNPSFDLSLKF